MRLSQWISAATGRCELRRHRRVHTRPVLALVRESRGQFRVCLPGWSGNTGARQVQLHRRGRVRKRRAQLRTRVRER